MNASHINTITRAFTLMATAALDYSKAAQGVLKLRADGADTSEVRELAQQVLLAKVSAYRAQVHPESGKPAKGSAYQRAVSRLMADTDPLRGERVNHAAKQVRVARDLQAAIEKLVADYGKAAVREGLKRVTAAQAE